MTRSQAAFGAILVAQAIVAYALTQPDYLLPPIVKFVCGAASVGLAALSGFLKISPPIATVTVPGGAKPVGGE